MNLLLDEYKTNYFDTITAIKQVEVMTSVSSIVLSNFPKNMPPEVREPFDELFEIFIDLKKKAEEQGVSGFEYKTDINLGPAMPLFSLVLTHIRAGKSDQEINFERINASQKIVMTFAYLDAFMNDSIRLICKTQPNVLKSKKTISWDKVITAGGWDNLLNNLIDEFVYEFGWDNVATRIEKMEKQFGIKLGLLSTDIQFLNNAENIRHVFVHSGGRATRKFLEHTKIPGLKLGSLIPIEDGFLENLTSSVTDLTGKMFQKIVEKFFKVEIDYEHLSL